MKHTRLALCLSVCLLTALPALAADLFAGSSWALLTPKGGADLTAAPGARQILHVVVHRPADLYYQVELTHDVAAAVPAGGTLHYHFMARSPTGCPIHAVIEKRTAPYTRVLDEAITLTPTWTAYTFTARVPTAYAARGLAARLQIGQKAGVTEFKGLSMSAS